MAASVGVSVEQIQAELKGMQFDVALVYGCQSKLVLEDAISFGQTAFDVAMVERDP